MSYLAGNNIYEMAENPRKSPSEVSIAALQKQLTDEEKECERLQTELAKEKEQRAKAEALCAAAIASKEDIYQQMVEAKQEHSKMMKMHHEMQKECAQHEARANALVMQIDRLEIDKGVEMRARMEAEKRCTAMMDTLKKLTEPKEEKEVMTYTPTGYRLEVTDRDMNGDFRGLRLIPETT